MKTRHLFRYGEIGRLLVEHRRAAAAAGRDAADEDLGVTREDAEKLALEFETMGPTFVKLGQLLSTRADVLPPVYLQALARLPDHVAPISFDEVERVVTTELGARLSRAFSEFDSRPVAAAS